MSHIESEMYLVSWFEVCKLLSTFPNKSNLPFFKMAQIENEMYLVSWFEAERSVT